MTQPARQPKRGIVLPLVLIIALLLSAAILTFVQRSIIDGLIVRNRDKAAAAEALARGGVPIAIAILVHDRYAKSLATVEAGANPGATLEDVWAKAAMSPLETEWGGTMELIIEDAGARFNLNSLVPVKREGEEGQPSEEAEEFLVDFIEKILDELEPQTEEERMYDAREMARNLLDYIDDDDVAINGRTEDEYYRSQEPPYVAANRPLLSVEEVAMVEGFDAQIAEAMRPYVTVHPLLGQEGINLNTAPPHVLALTYSGSTGDMRLADEEIVREIMKARDQDYIVCTNKEGADNCTTLSDLGLGEGSIFPTAQLPMVSQVFTVTARASVDDITRTVEAVVDVTTKTEPRLLSWRTR
jgi:type II secretory pathway component PulK